MFKQLSEYFSRSLRRRLIDKDLANNLRLFKGRILDLGGARTRGSFPHGKDLGWVVADENWKLKPSIVADAHELPFKNSSFNAVKCSELTGYLMQPYKMLMQVKNILKLNGVAVFTCPFLTPYDAQQHDGIRLTAAWWRWASKKIGLKVVKIKPQGYLLTVMSDYLRLWISYWWWPMRYLGYLIIFPLTEIAFWWEQNMRIPNHFKRYSTGFLIILKKTRL